MFASLAGAQTQPKSEAPLDALFAGQRVIYSSLKEEGTHLLTLSALKKINGEWLADREELISGRLEGKTFELTRPFNFDSAWNEVQRVLTQMKGTLIYECHAMACGSSNAWANERFEVKQLYGLDLSQRYQVWQVQGPKAMQFVSVYLVQRGNRRIYFQLNTLASQSPNIAFVPGEEVIARKFYRDKQVELVGLTFEQGNIAVNAQFMATYAKAFNQQPFKRLSIEGYDYFPGNEQEQKSRGLAYAEAVYDALAAQGVQKRRLSVIGVAGQESEEHAEKGRVIVRID